MERLSAHGTEAAWSPPCDLKWKWAFDEKTIHSVFKIEDWKPKPFRKLHGGDIEIHRYAHALQMRPTPSSGNGNGSERPEPMECLADCPALSGGAELYLKSLVGEGSNFLKQKTDPISLSALTPCGAGADRRPV